MQCEGSVGFHDVVWLFPSLHLEKHGHEKHEAEVRLLPKKKAAREIIYHLTASVQDGSDVTERLHYYCMH